MAERPRRARGRGRRWSAIERDLRKGGATHIAGVDEVGRGSLAGPVVACAVIMPSGVRAIAGVDDSKRLTREERERLCGRIRRQAVAISLGAASSREIDRVNIYHATVLAMRRALGRLPVAPDQILVDGRPIRTLGFPHTAIVGGDGRCFAIACASIVAKVTRDRLMRALARRHPAYGWERNVGYGTGAHWTALDAVGRCAHHRGSFIEGRQLVLGLEESLADESFVAEELALGALSELAPPSLLLPPVEPERPLQA